MRMEHAGLGGGDLAGPAIPGPTHSPPMRAPVLRDPLLPRRAPSSPPEPGSDKSRFHTRRNARSHTHRPFKWPAAAPSPRRRRPSRWAGRPAQEPGTGRIYMIRSTDDDDTKGPLLALLLALAETRHGCAELLRAGGGGCDGAAFLAAAAPAEAPLLRAAARELLARLRLARAALGGGPAPPHSGAPPAADRVLRAVAPLRAPELHALRTLRARASTPVLGCGDGRGYGESDGGGGGGCDRGPPCAERTPAVPRWEGPSGVRASAAAEAAGLSAPRAFSPLGRALASGARVSSFDRIM